MTDKYIFPKPSRPSASYSIPEKEKDGINNFKEASF